MPAVARRRPAVEARGDLDGEEREEHDRDAELRVRQPEEREERRAPPEGEKRADELLRETLAFHYLHCDVHSGDVLSGGLSNGRPLPQSQVNSGARGRAGASP